jgi:hypothetical protein
MSQTLNDLLKEIDTKISQLYELKSLVHRVTLQLQNEKSEHDKLVGIAQGKLISPVDADSEIVEFNVGGQLFTTYKSTLTKRIRRAGTSKVDVSYYEPNLLHSLASGLVDVKRDKNNAIFIDRNPKYLSFILDYLRTAETDEVFKLPACDTEIAGLLKEAEYFNIQ